MTSTTGAAESSTLLHTPFRQYHIEQGAKMVDFAGWEMPLLYGSIIEEHNQVRNSGGMFDVSHMGRFLFTGPDARAFLDRVCTRQIWGMKHGQARYSMVCNEQGGCHDDVLVYKRLEEQFSMVCNAANRTKLIDHFAQVKGDMDFVFEDRTLETAMIAMQGPRVMDLIGAFSSEVPALKRYHFLEKELFGATIMISRTGYTGEDGVEVILPAEMATTAVNMLMTMGGGDIIKPAGLGARDSLRLEAAMALYGHEITEELDPLSAKLNFAIKLNKADGSEKSPAEVGRFIGQDALEKIAIGGVKRPLVGLVLEGRRSARQEMVVRADGAEVGVVTSGCASPTLDKCIAMAYVDAAHAEDGTKLQIDTGKATIDAEVAPLPFYKAG